MCSSLSRSRCTRRGNPRWRLHLFSTVSFQVLQESFVSQIHYLGEVCQKVLVLPSVSLLFLTQPQNTFTEKYLRAFDQVDALYDNPVARVADLTHLRKLALESESKEPRPLLAPYLFLEVTGHLCRETEDARVDCVENGACC